MQINQVLEHFGESQTKVAKALGIAQSNVARWVKSGKVPYLRQCELQLATKGRLKAGPKPPPRKAKPSTMETKAA